MSEQGAALPSIDEVLGYRFRDAELASTALTHPSWANEVDGGGGNERLEFLGDAVLDLVIANELYAAHPDWAEGDLTRARAALVNQRALAEVSRSIGLGRFVKLGRTEQRSAGGDKDRVLANCLEALIGAVFLDGGLAPSTELLRRLFAPAIQAGGATGTRDPKTAFQEWAHAQHRTTPSYDTVGDSGVDHDEQRFRVEVRIGSETWGSGSGRSKRSAEQAAARAAIARRDGHGA
ncbi:MAG TPA: ribonuclease III [Myxococcota bacterium]